MWPFRLSPSTRPFQAPAVPAMGSARSPLDGVETVSRTSSPSWRAVVTSGSRGSKTPFENRALIVLTTFPSVDDDWRSDASLSEYHVEPGWPGRWPGHWRAPDRLGRHV